MATVSTNIDLQSNKILSKEITDQLTVLIPAYNEEESIKDTVKSIQNQTTPPKEIIVIDDGSTDKTGRVAKKLGVTVLRPPVGTGSKAGAQNYALDFVTTKYVMAIDADTTLDPEAIEKLVPALRGKRVAAVCGMVIPRYVKTVWERGRYIEYLFAFSFYKPIQEYFGKPLISSGCFSAYSTKVLKQNKGWPRRTMAEDMDLTWSFYRKGYNVHFIPEAVCYPIEPHDYYFMSKQLKRWSHGFVQNVTLHWKHVIKIPYLRSSIAMAFWDSTVASLFYLFVIPTMVLIFRNPLFLIGYVVDFPILLAPVLVKGAERKEMVQAVISLPSFFILRIVNSFFILEAVWSEMVIHRRLAVYEKGH